MRHALIDNTSVGKTRYLLRKMLSRSDRSEYVRGLRAGKLTTQHLHRAVTGETNLFQRRIEMDGVNSYVTIAIDSSSSMRSDSRGESAKRLACTLSSALSGCVGVRHDVLAWTCLAATGHNVTLTQTRRSSVYADNFGRATIGNEEKQSSMLNFGSGTVLTYLKTETDTTGALCKLIASHPEMLYMGGTPAFGSLSAVVRQLRSKRNYGRRFVLFLTDGMVRYKEATAMRRLCEEVRSQNIHVIGIGLCADAGNCFPPDSYITVRDPGELGGAAMAKLADRIAKLN